MNIVRTLTGNAVKHAPVILSSLAVAGVAATAVLATKAGTKLRGRLDTAYIEKNSDYRPDPENIEYVAPEELTKMEQVKAAWPIYIPTALVAAATIVCIFGAHKINVKRLASVLGAYYLTDEAYRAYKEKTEEHVGADKARDIHDAAVVSRMREKTSGKISDDVVQTGTGDVLFFDATTGRYFRSSVEAIRRAENTVNHRLVNGLWASLNELYSEIGLPPVKVGEELGWIPDNLIDVSITAMMTDDDVPCGILDFVVEPRFSITGAGYHW